MTLVNETTLAGVAAGTGSEVRDLMKQDASPPLRMMSTDAIRILGGTLPIRTSCRLNWPGVEVHHYRLPSAPCPSSVFFPRISIFLQCAGDAFGAGDQDVVDIHPPGTRTRTSRGKYSVPREVIAILLDPLAFSRIARAETGIDFPEIIPQIEIADPLIHSIGMLLAAELASENPKPRIYAESLAAALAAQVFARYTKPCVGCPSHLGTHWPELQRSIEFIKENLHRDLHLSDIAAVAMMSKYQFAKSFRRVIGVPPHRYLVTMRMEKARKLLEDPALTLEEVARRVGYADQAHFSEQFRKVIGASAKHYRLGPTAPYPAGRNCEMVGNGLRQPEWKSGLPVTYRPMIDVEATATSPVSIRT